MRIEPQLSIRKIDNSIANKPVETKKSDEVLNENKDTSSISKSGIKLQKAFSQNKSNAIMGLENQKEKVEQSKKEFLQRAKAEGMDSKEVAARTKEFDDQISVIEQQISQIKIEEQKKALGIDEEALEKIKEKQASNPNKTVEQVEKQEAQDLVSLAQGMDNVKSAMALRQQLTDTAKVIERQIATDIGNGAGTSIYADMLKEVNTKIADLSVAIGESMNKLENAVKRQNAAQATGNNKSDESDNENSEENNDSKIEAKTVVSE